jgi:hypothetical protein
MPKKFIPDEGFVGAQALADALLVNVHTIYKWCAMDLLNDLRNNPAKGQPLFFGLDECFQATALAPASKSRSWARKKYLTHKADFDRALLRYLNSRSRGGNMAERTKFHNIVEDRGYREGWDFDALYKSAYATYRMALHIQETHDSVRAPQEQFPQHASA